MHKDLVEKLVTGSRSESRKARSQALTRVISFTSGKGGVGKSHTVTNVGIALASLGRSVLILDGDMGLANIHVLLNLKPRFNLHDVLKGKCSLADIILEGPGGVSVIPSSSGIEEMCNLSPSERLLLMNAVEEVGQKFDYLLIDTQAGIGEDVMSLNSAASEIVCVVTPEPTSLTDAYALVKVLSSRYGERRVSVVVNQAESDQQARRTFSRLSDVVGRYLNVELRYLGSIPEDRSVNECIMSQKPLVLEFPSSPAGLAISAVARKFEDEPSPLRVKGGMQLFFRQMLELGAYGAEAGR